MKFESWGKMERHPIIINADLEALLVQCQEKIGDGTTIIEKHECMSFDVYVKVSDNVPVELLEELDILTVYNCNLCKTLFSDENYKVRDHDHLSAIRSFQTDATEQL